MVRIQKNVSIYCIQSFILGLRENSLTVSICASITVIALLIVTIVLIIKHHQVIVIINIYSENESLPEEGFNTFVTTIKPTTVTGTF